MYTLVLENNPNESLKVSEQTYKELIMLSMYYGYRPLQQKITKQFSFVEVTNLTAAVQKLHEEIFQKKKLPLTDLLQAIEFWHKRLIRTSTNNVDQINRFLEHYTYLLTRLKTKKSRSAIIDFLTFLLTAKMNKAGYFVQEEVQSE